MSGTKNQVPWDCALSFRHRESINRLARGASAPRSRVLIPLRFAPGTALLVPAPRLVLYVHDSQSTLQRYYVGSAENVEKRLQEHNSGKSKSTRAGVPWDLIHTEGFATRSEAMQREKKIKAWGIKRYLFDLQNQPKG